MVKNKAMQFFMESLKMNRKKNKNFLTFQSGDLNPRFSVIFPPMIWIFMESEEAKIKSKQASKKDRTVTPQPNLHFLLCILIKVESLDRILQLEEKSRRVHSYISTKK